MTARIGEELDYTLEAGHQQQAAEGFAGHPEFVVPTVLASTSKVMVSEWIEGRPLSTVREDSAEQRNAIGLKLRPVPVRRTAARSGLLHADPHPGNFKVLADGRLGVVDFGLVARMPDGTAVGDGPDPARSPNAATPSRCTPSFGPRASSATTSTPRI